MAVFVHFIVSFENWIKMKDVLKFWNTFVSLSWNVILLSIWKFTMAALGQHTYLFSVNTILFIDEEHTQSKVFHESISSFIKCFTVCPCLKNTFLIEFRLVAASDNSWDFHDIFMRFYYGRSRSSWWYVKIFMMMCRDFIMNGRYIQDDKSRFHYDRSRFYNKPSRFPWWQVQVKVFIMTGLLLIIHFLVRG